MKTSVEKALTIELNNCLPVHRVRQDCVRELQKMDQGIEERKAEIAQCDSWVCDIALFSPDGVDDVLIPHILRLRYAALNSLFNRMCLEIWYEVYLN